MEKERNIKQEEPSAQSLGVPAPFVPEKPYETRFQKIFWVTDVLINWLFNSIVSIGIGYTWEDKYGDHFNRCVDKSGNFLKKTFGFSSDAKEIGTTFMNLFALALPGWFLAPVMKKVRDYKLEIVQWGDKLLDRISPPSQEELIRRDEAYEGIKREPKSTWTHTALSRVGGIAFNWGTFALFRKGSEAMGKGKAYAIEQQTEQWANAVAAKPFARGNEKFVQRITNLTLMEVISCALTAFGFKTLMDITQKWWGKREYEEDPISQLASVQRSQTGVETAPAATSARKPPSETRMREDASGFTRKEHPPRQEKPQHGHSARFAPAANYQTSATRTAKETAMTVG